MLTYMLFKSWRNHVYTASKDALLKRSIEPVSKYQLYVIPRWWYMSCVIQWQFALAINASLRSSWILTYTLLCRKLTSRSCSQSRDNIIHTHLLMNTNHCLIQFSTSSLQLTTNPWSITSSAHHCWTHCLASTAAFLWGVMGSTSGIVESCDS